MGLVIGGVLLLRPFDEDRSEASLAAPLGIRRIDSRDLAADVDALGALRRAAARNEGGQNDNAHEKRPQIRPTLQHARCFAWACRRSRLGKVPRLYILGRSLPVDWAGIPKWCFRSEGAGVGLPSQSGSYIWRRHDQREACELIELLSKTPSLVAAYAVGLSGNGPEVAADRCRVLPGRTGLSPARPRDRRLQLSPPPVARQDRPHLNGFDGARVAAERDYDAQNFDEALAAFRDARLANVAAVASLTEAQLARSGSLEDTKDVTVLDVLTMMRDHDEDHLRQLRDLRGALQARRR